MTREEAQEFYRTREFYKIVDGKEIGPIDNIFLLDPDVDRVGTETEGMKYCQVIGDRVVASFREDEIVMKKINE